MPGGLPRRIAIAKNERTTKDTKNAKVRLESASALAFFVSFAVDGMRCCTVHTCVATHMALTGMAQAGTWQDAAPDRSCACSAPPPGLRRCRWFPPENGRRDNRH